MTHTRTQLASLFSSLKRTRPRTPFFQLPTHRVPTLWGLYRSLLREAPNEHVRIHTTALFKQNQYLTSPQATVKWLNTGYKWLDAFRRANGGDEYLCRVLERYGRMIASKRDRAQWEIIYEREAQWIHRLLNRPILTGGYLRPTFSNRPLPLLKPQPESISMMIRKRRLLRMYRTRRQAAWKERKSFIEGEKAFELLLEDEVGKGRFDMHFQSSEWYQPVDEMLQSIEDSFKLDHQRANTLYTPDQLSAIKQARREKILNKTREKERERRGEVLRSTLRTRRKGPPAHVFVKMTEEEKERDRVLREVGRAGYSGWVKTGEWCWQETGKPEDQERLTAIGEEIRKQNLVRRPPE